MRFSTGLLVVVAACRLAAGQDKQPPSTVDVSLHVRYTYAEGVRRAPRDVGHRTVLWLEPIDTVAVPSKPIAVASNPVAATSKAAAVLPTPATYTMAQKDKSFHPGLLVVPVGSAVSFPNADPFFHNVFSLFNGRRFDLGLYQSGQSRTVLFNRVGVSYIFCNIHPEMRAVIISLKTPYYVMPNAAGVAALRGVPEGSYRLEVWSELASAALLQSLGHTVKIDRDHTVLGEVEIPASSSVLEDHLNKFGQPYDPHDGTSTY